MNIKRILAGSLAAITAGATMMFAAMGAPGLGDYVTPDTNKLTSPIIVIGDGGTEGFAKDVIGAADIAAAVAGFATVEKTVAGAATVSVSGGTSASTVDSKLYMNSLLNAVKNTLTATDLPTLLAKGKVSVQGTDYTYNQYIALGSNPRVKYNTIADADILDPVSHILTQYGSTGATDNPIYTTSIVFNKVLNVSDSHVQGKKITLFGNEYTIAANSDYNTLKLQGYGITKDLELKTPVEITIGEEKYTVEATWIGTVSSTATLKLKINDASSDTGLIIGDTDKIGDLDIYVKSIYPASVAGQASMATVSFGSTTYTLDNATSITKGTDTTLTGTMVSVVGTSGSGISKVSIGVAAEDSTKRYVKSGESFEDPMFGTIKVHFGGLTADLEDSSRDPIKISAGNTMTTLSYTDYRGEDATQNFARIDDSNNLFLNATSTHDIVVIENETIDRGDYFLFAPKQESEFGHLLKLETISGIGTSSAKFTIRDVAAGTTTSYDVDSSGTTTIYIDGQQLDVTNTSTSAVTIDFAGTSGKTMAFPLIKLKNGEYLTLIDNRTAFGSTSGIAYELPGNTSATITNDTTSVAAGQIIYKFTAGENDTALTSITDASSNDMITTFPAVLVWQEKDDNVEKHSIGIPIYARDTANNYIGVNAPTFSDELGSMVDWNSNQYFSSTVDLFGTYVTRMAPTSGGETVKIYYPDTQAIACVGIGSNPKCTTAGGETKYNEAIKIQEPVAKLAAEIDKTNPGADLILVGGPCANSLVADLVTKAGIKSCADWDYATGVIKEVSDAFVTGKKALIVAGTTADDTRALAAKVMKGTLSFSA